MTNTPNTGAPGNSTASAVQVLAHQQMSAIVAVGIALLVVLWFRARWHRGRLSRSYGRAMRNAGVRRQLRGMQRNHVMARAGATHRATLAFRKAVAVAVTLGALWLYVKAHA